MNSKTKTRATKEKPRPALVPKLRFPEFRGADGWNADALGDVATFVNEKVPLERVALENYISTENILPDYGGVAKASKLPTTGSVTRYRQNDTLVSNIRPYLKKVWVADKEGGASNDVIVIRAKQSLLPQYFSCLLKNDAFIDYVMTGAKGVKMPRGDVGSMKAYPTLYPSKAEQQKIAECLSSVDELMAAQARKVAALKTHKKGLMQNLFPREGETVPRLRFPEFREAEGWTSETGDSLFDQINDRNSEPGLPVLAITQEHGAIPRHMIDYHVSVTEKSIKTYKVVRVGDFIISLRSFQGGIEYSRYHGICSPAYVILRRRIDGSDEYFRHYLKTDRFIRILTKNLEGLRDGKMISYAQFSELMLLVPKPDEQHRIASCLSSLDALITAETQKLEALKTHKKGLMQQLFPSVGGVAGEA